jgi:hypothetical protein
MSMKTKEEVKKSSGQAQSLALTHSSPGSLHSPPSPRGKRTADEVWSGTRSNARKYKNRGNKPRMSMKIKDKCAGIDRQEAESANFSRERVSDPLGPKFCAVCREVHSEA